MATGGSLPSCSSGSPPVEEDPTFSHGNPNPGDMAGDEDRMDTSYAFDSDYEHFKFKLDVLSKCIDQVVTQDRKKTYDRYFPQIKKLIGKFLDDDDDEIYSWMSNPNTHLSTGDDSDNDDMVEADDERTELYSLAVLIINAPVTSKFPPGRVIDISLAAAMCEEFNTDKPRGRVLVLEMMEHTKESEQKMFRIGKYKLGKGRRLEMLNSLSSQIYKTMPYSADVLNSNEFKLVLLYVEKDEACCLGWPSTDESKDIYSEIRKQSLKLCRTLDEESKIGHSVAKDYIESVGVIEEAKKLNRVTVKDVTSKANLCAQIETFMTNPLYACNILLVIYVGHGSKLKGDLCLEEDTVTQRFVLKELQKHQNKPKPTIFIVWDSCYSYLAIPEQEDDDSIQVIPLQKTYDPNIKADPNRTIRTFHLTNQDTPMVTRSWEEGGKYFNVQLKKFGKKQVSGNFAKPSAIPPFDISVQPTSGKETEKPSTGEISGPMKKLTLATDDISSAPHSQEIRKMDLEMECYLTEIGVSIACIEKMTADQITADVIRVISDADLSKYISAKGHQILVRNYCLKHQQCSNVPAASAASSPGGVFDLSEQKQSLLQNIGSKTLKIEKISATKPAPKGNCKPDRIIEIGWSHFNKEEKRYIQVRRACGGGIRLPRMPKSAYRAQIMEEAKRLFTNIKADWEFDLALDVSGINKVPEHDTITIMVEQLKMRTLRVYLLSKQPTDVDNSDDELPDLVVPSDSLKTVTKGNTAEAGLNVLTPPDSQSSHCPVSCPDNLHDALFELLSKAEELQSDKKNIVNVTRQNPLDGGFRAFCSESFQAVNKLSVKFRGEQGIDQGGPTREFLRIALAAMQERLFAGPPKTKHLRLDVGAYEEKQYETAGKILAYSIVHRGPLPRFFSNTLYAALVFGIENVTDIDENLIDEATRQQLQSVAAAVDAAEFHNAVESIATLIDVAGCSSFVSFPRKMSLVKRIQRFLVIDRMKDVFVQFKTGLTDLGLLDMVKRCPEAMRTAFQHQEEILQASTLVEAFSVALSPSGSNERADEDRTLRFWRDYLIQAEDEEGAVKLKSILTFATCLAEMPVLGFSPPTTLGFKHDDRGPAREFPMAITCVNQLMLPIVATYGVFKERMDAAIAVEGFTCE